MKIKQLLLTTDFSENARKAYHSASSISRQFDAQLHLVHFAGVAPSFIAKTSSETYYETHEQALRQEAATHVAFDGVDVTAHLMRHRWSPNQLRGLEKELGIDMVVMGTHGRTGLQHFVLGSFAERVVRNSSAPVLVLRQGELQADFRPKQVVVPFDFSEASNAVLPAVRLLSDQFQCSFRFIYVYEPVPPRNVPVFLAVREFLASKPKEPVEERFAGLVQHQLSGVDASLETHQGVPATEILSRVRELEADVVLVGTHGVLGSFAQHVTRDAPCSVLTVPNRLRHAREDENERVAVAAE